MSETLHKYSSPRNLNKHLSFPLFRKSCHILDFSTKRVIFPASHVNCQVTTNAKLKWLKMCWLDKNNLYFLRKAFCKKIFVILFEILSDICAAHWPKLFWQANQILKCLEMKSRKIQKNCVTQTRVLGL